MLKKQNLHHLFLTVSFMLTVLLTGCNHQSIKPHKTQQTSGDMIEQTASVDHLPSFLQQVDPDIKTIYQLVAKNQDVTLQMACYCGCADMGHKSNRDCFIHDIKKDGSIVWNSHAVTCKNCLEIAAESIQMKQEGKSLKDIRHVIDEQYREGYPAPTPTPVPEA